MEINQFVNCFFKRQSYSGWLRQRRGLIPFFVKMKVSTMAVALTLLGCLATSACAAKAHVSVEATSAKAKATANVNNDLKLDQALVDYVGRTGVSCQPSIVRKYVSMGASPNAVDDKDSEPVVILAVLMGASDCALELIHLNAAVTNSVRDAFGNDALIAAVGPGPAQCNVSVLEALLAHGADANDRQGLSGETALQYAASNQNLQCAKVLLVSGADVNAEGGKAGITALMGAQFPKTENGHERSDMTRLLLVNGANPNMRGRNGVTALFFAMSLVKAKNSAGACLECVTLLLDAGANPNEVNDFGETPLLFALRRNFQTSLEAVQALVAGGANVNMANEKTGETPLMAAAAFGSRAIVMLLLKEGADRCAQDKQHQTASDYANNSNHSTLAKELGCSAR